MAYGVMFLPDNKFSKIEGLQPETKTTPASLYFTGKLLCAFTFQNTTSGKEYPFSSNLCFMYLNNSSSLFPRRQSTCMSLMMKILDGNSFCGTLFFTAVFKIKSNTFSRSVSMSQ